jgi:hypothetical protein
MTPELKKFIIERSTGTSGVLLDSLSEEIFQMYMRDLNSSTIREAITILVPGYTLLGGKLGRDGIDTANNRAKEAKPKLYTGHPTNGGGCFNDYTRERLNKDVHDNLDIVHSLFVGDRLVYIMEFNIDAIKIKLDKQIHIHCEEGNQKYVRSASWTYADWIHHDSTKIHYIDYDQININKKCINKPMQNAIQGIAMLKFLI